MARRTRGGGRPAEEPDSAEIIIPLASEELTPAVTAVETGRVSVRRLTREREAPTAEWVVQEHADVTRTPVGRDLDGPPEIRWEGDTLVIPVVEERLALVRQLVLVEEVRVTLVRSRTMHTGRTTLRRQEVEIAHTSTASPSAGELRPSAHSRPTTRSESMKYQTIAAAYDSHEHAVAAANALKAAGFHPADVSILDKNTAPQTALWTSGTTGLWQRIFGKNVVEHEARVYHDVIDRGGALVSVRAADHEVAHATGILDLHHPIDVRDRALTSGIVTPARAEAATKLAPPPLVAKQEVALPAKLASENEQVLRLADEQLQVGKKMIETGKTRVRRFVTEREVSADVTLHEEHAEIMRRAVTDPKYLADVDWADREIEVVETAEQALVSKTARVVEEVALRKVGSDHLQTLHEKVRRQEVEVEKLAADGKPISGTMKPMAEAPALSR